MIRNAIDRALYAAASRLPRPPATPPPPVRHEPWHRTIRVGPYVLCREQLCPVNVVR